MADKFRALLVTKEGNRQNVAITGVFGRRHFPFSQYQSVHASGEVGGLKTDL